MDFDRRPSRPIVKSTVGAQAEWEYWLYENHFQRIMDGDGLDWHLEMSVHQLPDREEMRGGVVVLTLQLGVDVKVDQFVSTGTLDPQEDERMISMIGDRWVPLRMRPIVHEAKGEAQAKELLATILPELRENIGKSKMRDIKRGLIGRWLDEQAAFGVRERDQNW